MLANALTGRTRFVVYMIWRVVAVVAGTIQVGYLTDPRPDPQWVSVMVAAVLYVGYAIGALAGDNVPTTLPATIPVTPAAPAAPTPAVNVGVSPAAQTPAPVVPDGYIMSESGIVAAPTPTANA